MVPLNAPPQYRCPLVNGLFNMKLKTLIPTTDFRHISDDADATKTGGHLKIRGPGQILVFAPGCPVLVTPLILRLHLTIL